MKVKVASITVQYPDGDTKDISIEDAKQLFKQLEELFGDKTAVVPSMPVFIERDRWPRWYDHTMTPQPFFNSPSPSPTTPTPFIRPLEVWCKSN